MDLRYRTIDNEQYSINVRLVGLYVAMVSIYISNVKKKKKVL